mmetsp:Transcript_20293/g.35017  ORF Transcript_20293/g.35017 Transcript_20293/m.35017 type:complete len:378 (+) Transcript_20293:1339-2472(+)
MTSRICSGNTRKILGRGSGSKGFVDELGDEEEEAPSLSLDELSIINSSQLDTVLADLRLVRRKSSSCKYTSKVYWNVSKLASVGGDTKAPAAARKATPAEGPAKDAAKVSDGVAAMSVSAPGATAPNAAPTTSAADPNASSQPLSSITSTIPEGWQSAVSSWWNSAKTIANEEVEAYKRGEYEQLLREAVEYTSKKSSELGKSIQEQTFKGANQVSRSLTELEEKMELDRRLNESLEKMEKMAADVDNRLKISERSGIVVKIGSEKLHEFDEKFYMSQRLQSAADNTLSNEAIASLIRDVNARTAQLWQSAQELFTEAEKKTNQLLLGDAPSTSSAPASANVPAGGAQDAGTSTTDGIAASAPSAPADTKPAEPAKP